MTCSNLSGSPSDNAALAYALSPSEFIFTPQQYGAIGDAQRIPAVSLVGNTVTSPYPIFTPADTGKKGYLCTPQAQPSTLRTLAYVSPTVAILSGEALHAHFNGGEFTFASQDDTAALKACFAAAMATKGLNKKSRIVIPPGGYLFSAPFMDLFNASGSAWGPDVIGAGKRRTTFYVSPEFEWGSLGHNGGVVTNHNQCNGHYSGFSVVGNYGDPGVFHIAMSFNQSTLRLEDIEIMYFRGGIYTALFMGSNGSISNCHIESNAGYGIVAEQVTNLSIHNTYHGNGTNQAGLLVRSARVLLFSGIQDESTVHNVKVDGGSELFCFGARFEGLHRAYALKVENSKVRLFGCNLRPYENHDNSGSLDIDATSHVFAAGCQIKGTGTRYAILNSGTFEDGGGNFIEGTGISNTGTLRGVQGAPVSDATDEASAVTQLNALLAALRTNGVIAT